MTPGRVGRRIKRLREQRGLSQREVAEPNISASYLSLIESGDRVPSAEILDHIAAQLGVDADELATGRPAGLEANLELDLQQARTLAHQGRPTEARELIEEVLSKAKKFDTNRLQARALTVLALLIEELEGPRAALEIFDEADRLWKAEPLHLKFEAVVGIARCHHTIGETRYAAHLLETYLMDMERDGVADPTAKMRVNSSLVGFYRTLGMARQSTAAAEIAIDLVPEVKDPEQIACMNMNVARALLDQGRHSDALAALRSAEAIYDSLEWPTSVARTQLNRGIVEAEKGNLDQARDCLTAAAEELGAVDGAEGFRGYALNELASVERQAGDPEKAIGILKEARKLLGPDNVIEHAYNRREMALCLERTDPGKAEAELRKAVDAYRAAGANRELATTLLHLGRLLREQGDVDSASLRLEEGLQAALAE